MLRRAGLALLGLVVLFVAALLIVNLLRPLPDPAVEIGARTARVPVVATLPWPGQGAAALGVVGEGVVAQTPAAAPMPTASTAKMMTALVVLRKEPLAVGEPGPEIPITQADVTAYEQDLAQDQSVVPVAAGQDLTELQALQALLLPSANNVAAILAAWAYGSLADGVAAMNQEAAAMGLSSTHFVDASGFDPGTVSSPHDLVLLGEEVMGYPVVRQIVDEPLATIPVAGTIVNVNSLLGADGILGIKTGNTDQAGGCFVFAAEIQTAAGASSLLVGAVMGLPDLEDALDAAPPLIDAARSALRSVVLVRKGQIVARYRSAWGQIAGLASTRTVRLALWQGTVARFHVQARPRGPLVARGARVGSLGILAAGERLRVPLRAASALSEAPWQWRLLRRPVLLPAQAPWPWR
jgi:serine-type D-Ala-D-Ala carboxypeptidase (penicillin-binding protein 5/6)